MESEDKKSKRSLGGEDVYGLACRYDVGCSNSKKKRKNSDDIQIKIEVSIA
jgi:hypothetical protein